ncbi:MAG TPA: TrbC/VirB2 family protein [Candidatus Dojkabacteria bacterium]|nr:TrbC/VirB2 family protein [Candidatus Dojkabacteria bacterium]HQI92542.1 TrbC/VirB2 family protein [Candidatus Dojkabacteria bacterium]
MKAPKVLAIASSIFSGLYLASGTYAQTALSWVDRLKGTGGVTQPLESWIGGVINLVVGLAALVCVGILIASGYMYITAAGDETKVGKAGKSLTYAIVGLVICFIAVILVEFVLKNVLK